MLKFLKGEGMQGERETFFKKFPSPPHIQLSPISTLDGEFVFTSGAADAMLAFSLGQSEDCFALRAFAVDVSFSVTELIFSELEEIAELFVLGSPFCDITRHRSIKYVSYKSHSNEKICEVKQGRVNKK